MARDELDREGLELGSLTQSQVRDLIIDTAPEVLLIETAGLSQVRLPEGSSLEFPLLLDDALILVQPDGTLIILIGAEEASLRISADATTIPLQRLFDVATPSSDWEVLGDVVRVPLHFIANPGTPVKGSAFETAVSINDPLIGLDINPLLPPTDYALPERFDRLYAGNRNDGSGPANLIIVPRPVTAIETDGPVTVSLKDSLIFVGDPSEVSAIQSVSFELPGLPAGSVATDGTLTPVADGTFILSFSGTLSGFDALQVIFPRDFSTQSRSDAAEGPLPGKVTVEDRDGELTELPLPIRVTPEGDVTIDDSLPDTVPDETDDPTPLVPAELL
ncbi:hypothetical protein ACFORG_18705, partial [Lutimaribacter marinistellae]